MTRTWMTTIAVLCLQASIVSAQQHFTVSTPQASIYKAPTNVSPVIGEARQGATLEVTRDVGSWVKVAWSKSPDGVGYIRKTNGTMSTLGPAVPATPASKSAAAPAGASQPVTASAPRAGAASSQVVPGVRPQPAAAAPVGIVAPSHRIGVGALVGGAAMGTGFSVRGWSSAKRFGAQLDVHHYSISNELFFTRFSSTQFGPKLLYAFRDRVSDRTWVRPYMGAGAGISRASVTDPGTGLVMSDTGMAAQLFGGTEVTLAAVPRLGLSADLGYQWNQTPFPGYSVDGAMFTVSAHWYLK